MTDFLDKLLEDVFPVAVGMKSGTVFTCSEATLVEGWLQLRDSDDGVCVWDSATHLDDMWAEKGPHRFRCLPRGVDVRLSDVEWIADAPWGS